MDEELLHPHPRGLALPLARSGAGWSLRIDVLVQERRNAEAAKRSLADS